MQQHIKYPFPDIELTVLEHGSRLLLPIKEAGGLWRQTSAVFRVPRASVWSPFQRDFREVFLMKVERSVGD